MTTPTWPCSGLRWPDSVPTLIDPDRRVQLRAHRADDLARVVEMCTDPEFVRWTTTPHPYSAVDGRVFLGTFVPTEVDAGRSMMWAVAAIDSASTRGDAAARFCGTVEIRLQGDGVGEIAFGLHPDARGQGLLRRAGRLALDWAFDVAGLRAVRWRAVVGNWDSRHLAAALGFRFEGVRRAGLAQRGVLTDCWTATVLSTDPRTSVAPPRQPTLRGAGVILRPFAERDLPRIVEACADPQSQHWLGGLPRDYRAAHARDFLEHCRETAANFTDWTWSLTTPETDECQGALTLFHLRDGSEAGELGYWTHPDARGRGLTGAAARAVADFALGELADRTADGPVGRALTSRGIHRSLTVRVAVENHASQAVARRTGADLVGRLPEAERLGNDRWTDLFLFSRTRRSGAVEPGPADGHSAVRT